MVWTWCTVIAWWLVKYNQISSPLHMCYHNSLPPSHTGRFGYSLWIKQCNFTQFHRAVEETMWQWVLIGLVCPDWFGDGNFLLRIGVLWGDERFLTDLEVFACLILNLCYSTPASLHRRTCSRAPSFFNMPRPKLFSAYCAALCFVIYFPNPGYMSFHLSLE